MAQLDTNQMGRTRQQEIRFYTVPVRSFKATPISWIERGYLLVGILGNPVHTRKPWIAQSIVQISVVMYALLTRRSNDLSYSGFLKVGVESWLQIHLAEIFYPPD